MNIQEKFKANVLSRIKKSVRRTGNTYYELCNADDPEKGVRVELPNPDGLTDVWFITDVGFYSSGLWVIGRTLASNQEIAEDVPLDSLPEPILQQVYSRMLDLEFV